MILITPKKVFKSIGKILFDVILTGIIGVIAPILAIVFLVALISFNLKSLLDNYFFGLRENWAIVFLVLFNSTPLFALSLVFQWHLAITVVLGILVASSIFVVGMLVRAYIEVLNEDKKIKEIKNKLSTGIELSPEEKKVCCEHPIDCFEKLEEGKPQNKNKSDLFGGF